MFKGTGKEYLNTFTDMKNVNDFSELMPRKKKKPLLNKGRITLYSVCLSVLAITGCMLAGSFYLSAREFDRITNADLLDAPESVIQSADVMLADSKESLASKASKNMMSGEPKKTQESTKESGSVKPAVAKKDVKKNAVKQEQSTQKVVMQVNNVGRANPFLPFNERGTNVSLPKYEILTPPAQVYEDSEAARLMNTIVSGILYDQSNPSAIINIEGSDYLVKKGDEINSYKVLAISKDQVTVQLGKNVYKAGVGEILTEGQMNHNTVSNLSNKFGGADKNN